MILPVLNHSFHAFRIPVICLWASLLKPLELLEFHVVSLVLLDAFKADELWGEGGTVGIGLQEFLSTSS